MLNKKDAGPTKQAFEYREVLLSNIDLSVDVQNFKYRHEIDVKKATQGKIFIVKCEKDIQTNIHDKP